MMTIARAVVGLCIPRGLEVVESCFCFTMHLFMLAFSKEKKKTDAIASPYLGFHI